MAERRSAGGLAAGSARGVDGLRGVPCASCRSAPRSTCARTRTRSPPPAAALGVALPVEPNTVGTGGGRAALWLGPDEWLVVGADGDETAIVRALEGAEGWITAVDVSANRTVLELAGPRAREVLAKGCSLDLHPRAFGPGQCAQTALARTQVILEAVGDARLPDSSSAAPSPPTSRPGCSTRRRGEIHQSAARRAIACRRQRSVRSTSLNV